MINLLDRDKKTLLGQIDNTIYKSDSHEFRVFFSHGYVSDLLTYETVTETYRKESRFARIDMNNYYLVGVNNCFSNGLDAAKFAASKALGDECQS